MFSLIITIIAIALTTGVVGATMYYIGATTNNGSTTTAAAELLTQSEQIAAAIDMRGIREKTALNSVADLVTNKYLTELPTPPKAAYATAEPLPTDWTILKSANKPLVLLQSKIKEDVCLYFNQKFQGNAVIRATINPDLRIQCYGPTAPYSVLINPSSDSALVAESVKSWNESVPVSNQPASTEQLPQPQANGGEVVSSGEVSLVAANLPSKRVGQWVRYDFKPLFRDSESTSPNMAEVTWSFEGTLPSGLALNPTTGVLTGYPTAKGPAIITVKATYQNRTGQQSYTMVISSADFEVKSISAGYEHTCAVTTAGAAMCWGYGGMGQLGDNVFHSRSDIPVQVVGLTQGVASISAGVDHTCAVTNDGAAWCWGNNNGNGKVGNSNYVPQKVPVAVEGLDTGVKSIGTGDSHSCALLIDGTMKCWGSNADGQAGIGYGVSNRHIPTKVLNLNEGVVSMSVGTYHTCAVTTAGAAKCWGLNSSGQLGNNSTVRSFTPVTVLGLESGVASISAGVAHTCAILTDGTAKCWGAGDYYGQLGNGSTASSRVPVTVGDLTEGLVSISAGATHTCAVTVSGGAKCWGDRKFIGVVPKQQYNLWTVRHTPVDVYGLTTGVAAITAGTYHTCAMTTDGTAKCWGYTTRGQVGNGVTGSFSAEYQELVPVNVVNP